MLRCIWRGTSCLNFFALTLIKLFFSWSDPSLIKEARRIQDVMGDLYMAYNDCQDAFHDVSDTGKSGTDIQGNKLTWVAINCLERASPEQKQIFHECYGSADSEKANRVLQLYEELGLRDLSTNMIEDSYKKILKLLENSRIPAEPFLWYFKVHWNIPQESNNIK